MSTAPFLWEVSTTPESLAETLARFPGVLQALRRGRNVEPGAAPGMLPYYARLSEDGRLSAELRAEHICLVLFGIHQQGKAYPVHKSGDALGKALRVLRDSGRFSESALDSRVMQLLTADSLPEIAHHLAGLIQQIATVKQPITLDYTTLHRDLVAIQFEYSAARTRRRWGAAYFNKITDASKEKTNA